MIVVLTINIYKTFEYIFHRFTDGRIVILVHARFEHYIVEYDIMENFRRVTNFVGLVFNFVNKHLQCVAITIMRIYYYTLFE